MHCRRIFPPEIGWRANVTGLHRTHFAAAFDMLSSIPFSHSRSPSHCAFISFQSRRNSPFNLSSFSRSRCCLIIVCQRARARDDDNDFNKQLFYLIKYVPLIKYFPCWFRCFFSHSFARRRVSRRIRNLNISFET